MPNCEYITGDGMATVHLNRAKSLNELVCAAMALLGQTRTHSPQSMHLSRSSVALRPRTRIACVGQTCMHAMRPRQRSASIFIDWNSFSMVQLMKITMSSLVPMPTLDVIVNWSEFFLMFASPMPAPKPISLISGVAVE